MSKSIKLTYQDIAVYNQINSLKKSNNLNTISAINRICDLANELHPEPHKGKKYNFKIRLIKVHEYLNTQSLKPADNPNQINLIDSIEEMRKE